MISDVVINQNGNKTDEDNAIDAIAAEQGGCQQNGAIAARHDELVVNRKREQYKNKQD